ncbi:MAG: DNA primase catalytic subunit PriS [Thermoplasmata archaeon]
MNDLSIQFVQQVFKKYYESVNSFGIIKVMKRELAFAPFSRQGMIRHTSFPSMESLVAYVRENTPQHFYYSSAYYENPSATMENKGWQGADLVFDIDGDHIPGSEKMSYGEMLATVKLEVTKLLNILTDDLGVGKDNLEIVFSGSRGYHVHVYSLFDDLESQERREIVDYISGRCIQSSNQLFPKSRWAERLLLMKKGLLNILSEKGEWREKLESRTGETTGKMTKKEIRESDYIERNARKLAIELYASKIDEPVTIDIHRLIRTPDSLHGKTGLVVKHVNYDNLEEFDPLRETIPEGNEIEVNVLVSKGGTVEIGERRIEVKEGRAKVPTYAAVFMILRGTAELVKEGNEIFN